MKLQSFKLLVSLCLLTAFQSVAADQWFMPNYNSSDCCCEPPACWQGFYLSGQIGGGWHKHHARFTNDNVFNTLGPVDLGSRFNIRSSSFVGGGGVGYNFQWDDVILGVEGGALTANHRHTRSSSFISGDRFRSHLDWVGYAKARLGIARCNYLFFITGGWAGGNPRLRLSNPILGVSASSSNKWINGWTLGGGIDYKIWDCFSVGLAYDYIQLQNRNRTLSCPNCAVVSSVLPAPRVRTRHHLQTLVVRLNYHFNLFNLW